MPQPYTVCGRSKHRPGSGSPVPGECAGCCKSQNTRLGLVAAAFRSRRPVGRYFRISRCAILWRATKWRSVKYEEVYLHGYVSGSEARRCLTRYFSFYNGRRVHEALDYATPDEVYLGMPCVMPRAA